MARIWFLFSSRLLNHPESVLNSYPPHRTFFSHLLSLASHQSRTQAPIYLVLRRCVPWLQEPEASSMEAGLQAVLGVRRSSEQIRGGRKPGGRGGGDVGGCGSTKLGARGGRIERGDDWIAVRGHRIGRGGVKPAFSSQISVHPRP